MPAFIQIGKSGRDYPIEGFKFGRGSTKIAFVGGIHGFPEINTVFLIQQAIQYFTRYWGKISSEVSDKISVVFIPLANPEGYYYRSRTNGMGVDLNRNWGVNWQKGVDAGDYPFSEPETIALYNFLKDFRAVVFYHSISWFNKARKIIPGQGGGPTPSNSKLFSQKLADEIGYLYVPQLYVFPPPGLAIDCLDSEGILACDIEIPTYIITEGRVDWKIDWRKNLRGMKAAIGYVAG